ncbi:MULTISPECIES: hypothetical protein [unclassified Sulfitobacter]|jgi:hypothetical protein|uniref:hypothetical protein n=1 Tax=unclassified Sulfitobacter TaxID=196795 RepID=UPI000B065C07|nr:MULTISPECIES: hypothetical protein [unclassified Sulfitobacter]
MPIFWLSGGSRAVASAPPRRKSIGAFPPITAPWAARPLKTKVLPTLGARP